MSRRRKVHVEPHPGRVEDRLLAVEQFDELNRQFYLNRFGPHDYMSERLRGLLLTISSHDGIVAAVADGLSLGQLSLKGDMSDRPVTRAGDYAVLESMILFQHAAETLVRLFLAHRDLPPCPRLEVARMRSFAAFKKEVDQFRETIRTDKVQQQLCYVFIGTDRRAEIGPEITQELWDDRVEALTQLMTLCCDAVLDDAHAYNAAKHGLATLPGEFGISIGADAGPRFGRNGVALSYLAVDTKADPPKWVDCRTWVVAEANMSLTALVMTQMEALWNVATLRYVPGSEPENLPFITQQLVQDARRAGWDDTIVITSVNQTLLYYRE